MLFVTYWELNEDMPAEERIQIAQKLTSKGLFPPKGVKVLGWYGTPDNWGILLAEADNPTDLFTGIALWRSAGAGFFKSTKTAPALPIQETIPLGAEILKSLASS